jgi:hypothetical protein
VVVDRTAVAAPGGAAAILRRDGDPVNPGRRQTFQKGHCRRAKPVPAIGFLLTTY